MPTQDERIQTLEFDLKQFKTETLKAYTDMAYEMTILKGLGEDSIKRLAALERSMNQRFDALAEEIHNHNAILTQNTSVLNEHTALLMQILKRLDTLQG